MHKETHQASSCRTSLNYKLQSEPWPTGTPEIPLPLCSSCSYHFPKISKLLLIFVSLILELHFLTELPDKEGVAYFFPLKVQLVNILCFPHSSVGRESACNARDPGLIPGLGRSPGEGIGYPFQYSDLEKNSMDCIVHGVAKSWTQLSYFHFISL